MRKEMLQMSSWIEDVYLPKLRSRNDEMVFDAPGMWGKDDLFSERFLQIVWNELYVGTDVVTVDGTPVKILTPGTWNVSAGPDFQNASLVIGGVPIHGDVEIHTRTTDWTRHRHGNDPLYENVVLHVVWEHDGEALHAPAQILELKGKLPTAWHVLLQDVEDACYPYARQVGQGQCAVRWALSDDEALRTILASAGLACLTAKGERFRTMCHVCGNDQAVYEKFFDCLGFRHNRQPFRTLAQQVPLEELRQYQDDIMVEAVLLGVAGLLPDVTQDEILPQHIDYVQQLWDAWWHSGRTRVDMTWRRNGVRPFNSPERRLMAGIGWLKLTQYQPMNWLQNLCRNCSQPKELLKAFLELDVGQSYWEAFKDFRTKLKTPVRLLGKQRLKDILANLCLPYLLSLETGDDGAEGMADLGRELFVILPTGQENRLLTEAAHRFLSPPSRAKELLKGYCHQQGLLDIYRNFCLILDSDCSRCPFAKGENDENVPKQDYVHALPQTTISVLKNP